jgi:hypothetical protein
MENISVLPEVGRKLITHKVLDSNTDSFFVKEKNIITRKPNTIGTYYGYVPGAGGDVWWVKHEDETVAAYGYYEVEFYDEEKEIDIMLMEPI